ncbi:hypothetical protein CEUSTIGMA_g6936.t1 [Chlamydomonas eustigma]|uniref:Uncharacterized protein n=1 Tax=Chlamydomonas eustigma TaxID=1157962 RepID=A0A250X8U8_9CHLO|nr:hypothetical protein CEUSTIGMA_g6936.t1 [Chlamydomonas eustigma]|eukprot:GAX79495.1 hypothetical protein CEUSTIGMA_g6936.t1 [Chlamydomonas eustigma]
MTVEVSLARVSASPKFPCSPILEFNPACLIRMNEDSGSIKENQLGDLNSCVVVSSSDMETKHLKKTDVRISIEASEKFETSKITQPIPSSHKHETSSLPPFHLPLVSALATSELLAATEAAAAMVSTCRQPAHAGNTSAVASRQLSTSGLKIGRHATANAVPHSGPSLFSSTSGSGIMAAYASTGLAEHTLPSNYQESLGRAQPPPSSHQGIPSVFSAVAACKLGLTDQLLAALTASDNVVNAKDGDGRTCLHYAAGYGQDECVELLLKRTDVDAAVSDCNGDVPLHFAAIHGHPMAAYSISKARPDSCMMRNHRGQTPVDVASACDRGEVLNAMLLACSGCGSEASVEGMRRLLTEGAVPDTWAPNGSSALMLAASADAHEALKVLLGAGATLELQDALGRSALMFAAGNGAPRALETLLDAGACISQRDRRLRSVLDYAPAGSEVRSLLQARLAKLEAEAERRQADLLAHLEGVKTLQSHGVASSSTCTGTGTASSKTKKKAAKRAAQKAAAAAAAAAASSNTSSEAVLSDPTLSGKVVAVSIPSPDASSLSAVTTADCELVFEPKEDVAHNSEGSSSYTSSPQHTAGTRVNAVESIHMDLGPVTGLDPSMVEVFQGCNAVVSHLNITSSSKDEGAMAGSWEEDDAWHVVGARQQRGIKQVAGPAVSQALHFPPSVQGGASHYHATATSSHASASRHNVGQHRHVIPRPTSGQSLCSLGSCDSASTTGTAPASRVNNSFSSHSTKHHLPPKLSLPSLSSTISPLHALPPHAVNTAPRSSTLTSASANNIQGETKNEGSCVEPVANVWQTRLKAAAVSLPVSQQADGASAMLGDTIRTLYFDEKQLHTSDSSASLTDSPNADVATQTELSISMAGPSNPYASFHHRQQALSELIQGCELVKALEADENHLIGGIHTTSTTTPPSPSSPPIPANVAAELHRLRSENVSLKQKLATIGVEQAAAITLLVEGISLEKERAVTDERLKLVSQMLMCGLSSETILAILTPLAAPTAAPDDPHLIQYTSQLRHLPQKSSSREVDNKGDDCSTQGHPDTRRSIVSKFKEEEGGLCTTTITTPSSLHFTEGPVVSSSPAAPSVCTGSLPTFSNMLPPIDAFSSFSTYSSRDVGRALSVRSTSQCIMRHGPMNSLPISRAASQHDVSQEEEEEGPGERRTCDEGAGIEDSEDAVMLPECGDISALLRMSEDGCTEVNKEELLGSYNMQFSMSKPCHRSRRSFESVVNKQYNQHHTHSGGWKLPGAPSQGLGAPSDWGLTLHGGPIALSCQVYHSTNWELMGSRQDTQAVGACWKEVSDSEDMIFGTSQSSSTYDVMAAFGSCLPWGEASGSMLGLSPEGTGSRTVQQQQPLKGGEESGFRLAGKQEKHPLLRRRAMPAGPSSTAAAAMAAPASVFTSPTHVQCMSDAAVTVGFRLQEASLTPHSTPVLLTSGNFYSRMVQAPEHNVSDMLAGLPEFL